MAVEDFLNPSKIKIKQTIEKSVKQKPKTSELTTIEKPGRKVPKNEIPEEKKIHKRKIKRAKSSKVKISKAKREYTLILTEKPQAAEKIAIALGSPRRYVENRVTYFELQRNDKKILVASAVGHLFRLNYIKGQTGFPIFNLEWIPSHTQKKSAFTKRYFNLLKKLGEKSKEIIVATDFDTEGEVIGWNILRFIFKKEDSKRMKYSTLTKKELIKSYENPLSSLNWGQAYAGETRHKMDWFYGINLSRALMSAIKKTGSFKLLSIGRVQGPALKIIVNRDLEIENFKSKPYWQVIASTEDLELKHPKDIFDKSELSCFENITSGFAETKESSESLSPLHPFDLTTLQREAHRLYKINPSTTLKIAQSLYLNGLISYPRTSSQKIPKEIEPLSILKKLASKFPEANLCSLTKPREGIKSDPAHPSIYPTGDFKNLNSSEKKLYNLIVKRFICCFMPDAKTLNKRINLTAETSEGQKTFTTSGLIILEKSWLDIYPIRIAEKNLPNLSGSVNVDKISFPEKETKPPKRYTSASLVSILEKKNLGTKATRSMIVDTLFNRGYLDGKSIESTTLGKKLIETLETYSPIIIDENLTNHLETKMTEILSAKSNFSNMETKTLKNVEKIITDISKEFKANELEIGKKLKSGLEKLIEQQKENGIIMPCDKCKSGSLQIRYSKKTKKYFAGCSSYPNCKATYSLPPNAIIKKTNKKSKEGLPILQALKKGRKPWEFIFDPCWREKQKENIPEN